MAAQNQAEEKKQDPILDQLDEIDDSLDKKEEAQKKQKIKKNEPKKKDYWKLILLAVLGTSLGLGINAAFTSHISLMPSTDTSNGPTKQREVSDEEAKAIYDRISNYQYEIAGNDYTAKSTLSAYVNNGWLVKSDEVMPAQLQPGEKFECELIKGTYIIEEVQIDNNSKVDYQTDNVPMDSIRINDNSLIVTGPYGFKRGMSEDDLKKLIQNNDLPYTYDKYTYSSYYNCYVYNYDAETGHSGSAGINIVVRDGTVYSVSYDIYDSASGTHFALSI